MGDSPGRESGDLAELEILLVLCGGPLLGGASFERLRKAAEAAVLEDHRDEQVLCANA